MKINKHQVKVIMNETKFKWKLLYSLIITIDGEGRGEWVEWFIYTVQQ